MSPDHFRSQINRLTETFGKAHYSTERVKLIWLETCSMHPEDFTAVVTELIGCEKFAPLLPSFREAASRIRELRWGNEKRQAEKDAVDIWKGTYHTDEVKWICKNIRERIDRDISEEDWDGFMKLLGEKAKT